MAASRRLLLLLGLAVVVGGAWLAPLDSRASEYAEAGLKRALASFAAARALNAVISVVQGTEVAIEPIGVGVVLTPGQVLDPVNDLVEQFSTLMLTASVAFGIEIMLIKFGGHLAVSLALSILAIAWGAMMWRGESPQWLTRIFVGMLLVRFAVPLVVLGSEAGFRVFLEKDYADGQASIELSTRRLDHLAAAPPPVAAIGPKKDSGSWWPPRMDYPKWIDELKEEARRAFDVGRRYDEMKEVAGRAVEHIVKLIVVFLLQTLVVPLLLLWMLLKAGRVLAGIPAGRD
jgi:hypothetical protein